MQKIKNLLAQVAIINKKNSDILDATGSRFNIFQVCGVNHYENTHSAIIAEFLNPKGSHGLKSKFLECFIKTLGNNFNVRTFDCESADVKTEYSIIEGRIDIFITDNQNHALIIENKIYAGDQWEQLRRYDNFAKSKYKEGNYQIFYLTIWGEEASKQSGSGVDYKPISYKIEIINWLEKCVQIAVRYPMVRETINQYINHLKQLTNQDMDTKNKEEIIELLSKRENLEAAYIISNNFHDVRNYLINKIFIPQITQLCTELNLQNVSEEYDYVNTSWAGFSIINPKWKYYKIAFEFENKGLRNFIIGINHKDINIKNNETWDNLKSKFQKNNEMWVWNAFSKFPNWDISAMIAIQNGEMANIFAEEITKILELTKGLEM
jgi:hypothetical protein